MKAKHNALLAAITLTILVASCGKDSSQKDATPVNIPSVMTQEKVDPNDVFSMSRNGEKVTVSIKVDFSSCKQVHFLRNTTGVPKKRNLVARINPNVTVHEDVLPDARPYWYWLTVVPHKGKPKTFDPLRVDPDAGSTGTYVNVASIYKWAVARTYPAATIVWSFPSTGVKSLEILRKTNPSNYNNRISIVTTLEWAGEYVDSLPDPETDYWYWIEATLENGRIIAQGPIKAEFSTK